MESTKRAGWYKKGFNQETHSTPERAEASRRNGRLGGGTMSDDYRAVATLEIGSSALLKFRMTADGSMRDDQDWAHSLVRRVSKRTGRTFWKRAGSTGIIITRRA